MASVEQNCIKVLDSMKDKDVDLLALFETIMTPEIKRMKDISARFFARGGFAKSMELMLPHLGVVGKKKHSFRCLSEINKMLPSEIWRLISQILEMELDTYCKIAEACQNANSMTPTIASEFGLNNIQEKLDQNCLRLAGLIGVFCSDNSKEGVGDGGDDNVDNPERESHSIEVSQNRSQNVENIEREEGVVAVDPLGANEGSGFIDKVAQVFVSNKKRRRMGKVVVPVSKKRKVRHKSIIATVALCVLAYGHSRNANRFQIVMGYYLQGHNVTKDVLGALNRLGFCISYNGVSDAIKSVGEKN